MSFSGKIFAVISPPKIVHVPSSSSRCSRNNKVHAQEKPLDLRYFIDVGNKKIEILNSVFTKICLCKNFEIRFFAMYLNILEANGSMYGDPSNESWSANNFVKDRFENVEVLFSSGEEAMKKIKNQTDFLSDIYMGQRMTVYVIENNSVNNSIYCPS
uniref:uncharacterized protein LOC120326442 n=1 Tax=Styela clava TaxID=7725 RepID=UPI001939D983|nr:uncharacterized protein LOC120326442 [Styela clava]